MQGSFENFSRIFVWHNNLNCCDPRDGYAQISQRDVFAPTRRGGDSADSSKDVDRQWNYLDRMSTIAWHQHRDRNRKQHAKARAWLTD
jgi:hypothetical protein